MTNGASEILKRTTKTIAKLLVWLESNLAEKEILDIHQWANEWFYIVVKDTRPGWSFVEDSRIGFTVDIDNDKIMWSNEPYPSNASGGNCFVRTNKWKTLLNKRFGPGIRSKLRWYTNRYL